MHAYITHSKKHALPYSLTIIIFTSRIHCQKTKSRACLFYSISSLSWRATNTSKCMPISIQPTMIWNVSYQIYHQQHYAHRLSWEKLVWPEEAHPPWHTHQIWKGYQDLMHHSHSTTISSQQHSLSCVKAAAPTLYFQRCSDLLLHWLWWSSQISHTSAQNHGTSTPAAQAYRLWG